MNSLNDVITAIATPIGEGGISVIRLSGHGAIQVADRGFRGRTSLRGVTANTVHVGHFVDSHDEPIDEVVITVFRAPNSYTAEDVVEISCHGGLYVTRRVLDLTMEYGARAAEPGEFTRRAFVNGRIDLSQAEAVADLIRAKSEQSRHYSLLQLEGNLSTKIANIRHNILELCSLLEIELDFSEEEIETINKDELTNKLKVILSEIDQLLETFDIGKYYREGVKVVIAGRPNVGKSSLLNALLKRERAIVTHISGTTRDLIEENLTIDGLLIRLVDTAGVRKTEDIVEQAGIQLTEREVREADIVLFVYDVSKGFHPTDESALEKLIELGGNAENRIIILPNKIDLTPEELSIQIPGRYSKYPQFSISAKENIGIEELKKRLLHTVIKHHGNQTDKSIIVTNSRHRDSLLKAKEGMVRSLESLERKQSNDFTASDLHQAMNSLGEIIGVITTDEILNNIFSKFCVGK
jgi:tRNA modification GTPase